MHFGSNIKELRKRRRLSREQLADQLGVTLTTVTGWEIGRSYPHFQVLLKLRELLEINLESLVFDNLQETTSVESITSDDQLTKSISDLSARVSQLEERMESMEIREKPFASK